VGGEGGVEDAGGGRGVSDREEERLERGGGRVEWVGDIGRGCGGGERARRGGMEEGEDGGGGGGDGGGGVSRVREVGRVGGGKGVGGGGAKGGGGRGKGVGRVDS